MNIILWDYVHDSTFDLKISVGNCDLYFMVQWFCLIPWRLFDAWTSYLGIMSPYYLNINVHVGHCDLYFTVQWFLSYLEDYLMYEHTLGLWVIMTQHFTSKLMYVTMTCISWSSDFALYLKDCLMYEQYTSGLRVGFIGKAWFRRAILSCDSSYSVMQREVPDYFLRRIL